MTPSLLQWPWFPAGMITATLLYDISVSKIAKLQYLQNMAVRVVTGTQRFQHITPTLAQLYWHPVGARVEYKVAFLTFKTLSS
jgi:hypothetical protein